jgi:hypothetical protein
MSKKITDKIKELLTAEDFKTLEEAINKKLEQAVALKEQELKDKYDKLADEYVQKTVTENTEKNKATLIEEYDTKIKNIEKKVVTKLGSFLDHVISEQITTEAIEKLAINEIAMPVLEGIKKVFASNYVELDTDGSALIKQEQKKNSDLQKKLDEVTSKLMESEDRAQSAATFLLISEKTEGLTKTQKGRVVSMFKSKKFDEVESNIDSFVDLVKESTETVKPKVAGKGTMDEIVSEEKIVEQKPVIKEDDEEIPMASKANRFLVE